MRSPMPSVTIQLPGAPSRSYSVEIGAGLLRGLGRKAAGAVGCAPEAMQSFLIADEGLPESLLAQAIDALAAAGLRVTTATVPASEEEKSLATVGRLLEQAAGIRLERRDVIVALGGGIVGDVAGFVAATYRRGVRVIQCPTTLLAMVDASVGGKTGVNLRVKGDLRKNLVGAFWQPALVLADTDALASLPDRHLRSGLAECLKHGLISHATDAGLLDWTLDHLDKALARDPTALAQLIERNVRVKATFVVADEREEMSSGEVGRALLNLGHTFAHAIETIPWVSPSVRPDDAPLHHGEAVALGLVASAYTASGMSRLSWADAERIRRCVEAAGLPTAVQGLPDDEVLIAAMAHDKKVAGGRLRLVIPVSLGRAEVVENPPYEAVRSGLAAIRA